MNPITLAEMLGFAKVYSAVFGLSSPMSVSRYDKDLAAEAMKKMADNLNDWTHEQKESYKLLVDFVKEQS